MSGSRALLLFMLMSFFCRPPACAQDAQPLVRGKDQAAGVPSYTVVRYAAEAVAHEKLRSVVLEDMRDNPEVEPCRFAVITDVDGVLVTTTTPEPFHKVLKPRPEYVSLLKDLKELGVQMMAVSANDNFRRTLKTLRETGLAAQFAIAQDAEHQFHKTTPFTLQPAAGNPVCYEAYVCGGAASARDVRKPWDYFKAKAAALNYLAGVSPFFVYFMDDADGNIDYFAREFSAYAHVLAPECRKLTLLHVAQHVFDEGSDDSSSSDADYACVRAPSPQTPTFAGLTGCRMPFGGRELWAAYSLGESRDGTEQAFEGLPLSGGSEESEDRG